MSIKKLKFYLFLIIFVAMFIPTLASFFILDKAITHVFNLGFNPTIIATLDNHKVNLKKLKDLNPQLELEYKRQFDANVELTQVYSDLPTLKQEIFNPIRFFYLLIIGLSILLAMMAALFVSHKISSAFKKLHEDFLRAKEKTQYLEKISSWQTLIRSLAHEIKNPLTPIEVMATTIKKSYLKLTAEQFEKLLDESEQVITEEVAHIRNLLGQFNDLSKIPEPNLKQTNFKGFIENLLHQFRLIYTNVIFTFSDKRIANDCSIPIDENLIRQVITNIVTNAIEANTMNATLPSTGRLPLNINFELSSIGNEFKLIISNNGLCIAAKDIAYIFDPHFSTKKTKHNMGLGLSISKKIMLDHNGDIRYQVIDHMPSFIMGFERSEPTTGV
jgi:nitrogen fixation/metabolism regulation signal transduction histidine kinase